ncbi:hypothetical protein ABW20_dc0100148 [Dactylellina cionopaga]|nr:hypothetical protein ABW20_dc0100148 [Dactylellina cionopaga]
MPKFNPSAAKLLAVESYFVNHSPITAHSIKDLEKSLPTATGISGMQVKDYLTALVDDNKIRVEKIGSGNWYWCFKGDEKKQKESELKGWEKEVKALESKLQEVKEEIKQEKQEKEGDNDEKVLVECLTTASYTERAAAMEDIQRLTDEKSAMEKELALYANNDPVQIDYMRELVLLMKIAGNMHTGKYSSSLSYSTRIGSVGVITLIFWRAVVLDNIYAIEGYMKIAGMLSSDITAFKASLGIPEDMEDVE